MKSIVLLAVLGLFIAAPVWADRQESYGPPAWAPAPAWAAPGIANGWGPGAGWGWGGGPFGGGAWAGGYPAWGPGFGAGGPWGGWAAYGPFSQMPQDKLAQLRDLAVQTQRTLIGQEAALEESASAYWKAVDTYPLDRAAATKAWETLDGVRKQMLETRLDSMAKAQQILGKELWEQLHQGWGPYRDERRGPR